MQAWIKQQEDRFVFFPCFLSSPPPDLHLQEPMDFGVKNETGQR